MSIDRKFGGMVALRFYLPAFCRFFAKALYEPFIVLYLDSLGLSYWQIGLIVSCRTLGILVFDLPAGRLIGRLGAETTLKTAMLGMTIATFSAAISSNLWLFSFSLFCLGACNALALTSQLLVIRQLFPVSIKGRAMAATGGTMRLANLCGPLIASFIYIRLGISGLLALSATFYLITFFIFFFFFPSYQANSDQSPSEEKNSALSDYILALKENRRTFGTAGLIMLLLFIMRAGKNLVVPLWGSHIGLNETSIGTALSLIALSELAAMPFAGYIMDHHGRRLTAIICLALIACGYLLLPLSATFVSFIVALSVYGLGNGLGSGINLTISTDLIPAKHKSEFVGLWRFINDIGLNTSNYMVGFFSIFGLAGALMSLAVVGFSAAILAFFMLPETLRKK